jgi:hypothetical protein
MKTLQPLCAAFLLLVTYSVFAAESALPEIFKRAKDKFAVAEHRRRRSAAR